MKAVYGPEAYLPDLICYRIQQGYMLEPARAGDYDGAGQAGVVTTSRPYWLGVPSRSLRQRATFSVVSESSRDLRRSITSSVSGPVFSIKTLKSV